jgi:uncharacterized protein with von Willebrand factor type A (vWA) domain
MFFETNSHRERFDFKAGHADVETIIKYLSISAGGGTQFDGVLTEALARCTKQFDEDGKSKADIVFITDGEAGLDQKWIDKFNESASALALGSSRSSSTVGPTTCVGVAAAGAAGVVLGRSDSR